MLWTDHAVGTGTANLNFAGTGSATVGKYTSAWYRFNGTAGVSLDATAGVTSLSFLVNGALEDQGRVGFAVQDAFMYSATSCEFATTPATGRIDVAVRLLSLPSFSPFFPFRVAVGIFVCAKLSLLGHRSATART